MRQISLQLRTTKSTHTLCRRMERRRHCMADPEGRAGGPDSPPTEKSQQYRDWSGSLGKSQSYQASIQCWAKSANQRHVILMTFRWRADDGPLIVALGSSLLKKPIWIRACIVSYVWDDGYFHYNLIQIKPTRL